MTRWDTRATVGCDQQRPVARTFIGLSGDACVPEGRAERPEGERVTARRGDGIDLRGRTRKAATGRVPGRQRRRVLVDRAVSRSAPAALLHGIWFCTQGLISNATTNAAWIANNPTPTSTGTMSTFLDQGGGRFLRRRTRKNGTNGKRRWATRSYSDSAKGTISAFLGLPELRFLRRYTKRIGSRL
jgi:hypothetical protein